MLNKTDTGTGPGFDPRLCSSEELMAEIDRLMDRKEVDVGLIERYLSILQERDPVMTDFKPEDLLENLRRSNPDLFQTAEGRALTESEEPAKGIKHRRPFKAALSAAAVLICCAIAVSAVFPASISGIIRWGKDLIQIHTNPSGVLELPEPAESGYRSLEEALQSAGIGMDYCPKWVPSDFKLTDIFVRHSNYTTKYQAYYESSRGDLVVSVTVDYADTAITSEKEGGGDIYYFGNTQCQIVSNYDLVSATWQDGDTLYFINGNISEQEIKTMIDSI